MMRRLIVVGQLFISISLLSGADVKWSGEKTIDRPLTIEVGDWLLITPGARIKFTGPGRIRCRGKFYAENAAFSADASLDGNCRLTTESDSQIGNCAFTGITSAGVKYHNAAIRFTGGKAVFKNNVLRGCSSLEFGSMRDAEITGNQIFNAMHKGIVLFHCRDFYLSGNWIDGAKEDAIFLDNANNGMVFNNRLIKSGTGINIYNRSDNNLVTGNAVFDSVYGLTFRGRGSSNFVLCNLVENSSAGLRIWGVGLDNIVNNCVFYNCKAGITVQDIPAGRSLEIRNCVFVGNDVVAGNACDGLIMRHNLLWDNKQGMNTSVGEKIIEEGTVRAEPQCINPAESDYRPRPGSPLLGNGIPDDCNIGLFPGK